MLLSRGSSPHQCATGLGPRTPPPSALTLAAPILSSDAWRPPSPNLLSRNSLSEEEFARVEVYEGEAELLCAFAQSLESTCSMLLCVGVRAGVGIGDVAA